MILYSYNDQLSVAQNRILELQAREKRHEIYLAAQTLDKACPGFEEGVIYLRFLDPTLKETPSPYKRILLPEMRAYFEFACPLKGCSSGGFGLSEVVLDALSSRTKEVTGVLTCPGKRKRRGIDDDCCGLELHYHFTVRLKSVVPQRAREAGRRRSSASR